MAQLSAPIKSNSKNFTLPCEHCYMLISCSYMHNIHFIKEANLGWWISLLSVPYIAIKI